jgi:hypothetical protein
MADQARVLSLETLKDAKGALVDFAEVCGQTLMSVDADIGRVTQWLGQQAAHWKREVRKREEAVERCKTDIMRKRIIAAPEPASVVEEEKALRRAKAGVESAHRKLEAVRRWLPVWEREAMLYKSSTHGLSEALHAMVPAAAARLERMHQSLEAYTRLAPPPGDDSSPGLRPSESGEDRDPEAGGTGTGPEGSVGETARGGRG